MAVHHRFDDITIDDLRAQGSMKWTRMPDHLAAFVAEMDFGIAPVIAQALHQAVDTPTLGYTPPAIKDEMSAATSEFLHSRFSWSVPPERIYPTADVLSAYDFVLERFARPGTPVILPTPAYMPFFTITPMRGRDVIEVPMIHGETDRADMDLEGIARAFEQGAHVLILCNPHNPLGRVYTREELVALSEVVEAHGGMVFSDEIHAPLTFPGHTHLPYASLSEVTAGHTVTATSASKAWNIPGLKCAQLVITNDEHQAAMKDLAFVVSHGAATPGLIANTTAYRDGLPWLEDVLGYIDTNRTLLGELLAEHLPEVTYRAPEGTYIAWLDATGLPDIAGNRSWATFFSEEAKVGLTDGAACGKAGIDHLRMMLAAPAHVLEKIVLAMAHAVDRHR